jgi:hypothetical protein
MEVHGEGLPDLLLNYLGAAAVMLRSLSHGERVGERGYGLSMDLNPSPGLHLTMQSDLSQRER